MYTLSTPPAKIASTMSEGFIALGKRLQAKRKSLGLNQADVAQAVGMSRAWIGHLEAGRITSLPSPDTLRAIANKLHLDFSELVALAEYGEVERSSVSDEREAEFRERFAQLSPQERDALWPAIVQEFELLERLKRGGSA